MKLNKLSFILLILGFIMNIQAETRKIEIDENRIQFINRKNNILKNIKIPELKFKIPEIQIISLTNSETLYLHNDPSLPIVNIQFIIEGGLLNESSDEIGLYSSFVSLWESGGANLKKGEKISEELAEAGAEIEFSLQNDYIRIQFTTLKENFHRSFAIFKDILLKPEFDNDRLNIIKMQMIDSINRRNDKPESIGIRKIKEIMYYPKKIQENISREEVERIQRENIIKIYKKILTNRKVHIGIDGDISDIPVEKLFLDISREMGEVIKPFEVKKEILPVKGLEKLKNKIVVVKKSIPQSVIFMGNFIPGRNSDEFYALQVGNYLLGGGSFVSQLMREVRVKRGLAYYSYSQNVYDAYLGRFIASSGTTSEKVDETYKIMLDIIQKFSQNLTEEEIKIAKDSIINSFIFDFDNPSKLIFLKIMLNIQGIQDSYLEEFPEKIQRVKKEDIVKAFQKYIQPDIFWYVIVGPESIQNQLKAIKSEILVIEPETLF